MPEKILATLKLKVDRPHSTLKSALHKSNSAKAPGAWEFGERMDNGVGGGGWGKNGQRWSQTVKSSWFESQGALPAPCPAHAF